MRVIIKLDNGDTKHFNYPGIKRKWAIIKAMNDIKEAFPSIRGEIVDMRTTRF